MKTGDALRDAQGHALQLGPTLGRGVWGRSLLVRREGSEHLLVLKCPLTTDDVRGDKALVESSRAAILEQIQLYERGLPGLPAMEGRVNLPDGAQGYLLPQYPSTLERRIQDGMSLSTLLATLLQVTQRLSALGRAVPVHGNLRPSNILFDERGEMLLTDVVTPAARTVMTRLAATLPSLPPEAMAGQIDWTPMLDAYALCVLLLRGSCRATPMPAYQREGIGKQAAVDLRARMMELLKQEDANPRFHQRVVDRAAAVLTRGLSVERTPSPPYRFARLDELQGRLQEIHDLIRPQITTVGKLLLDRNASQTFFTTDEVVRFSCTVGCTLGVDGQEEVGVGMAVFDLDRDQRLKDLNLSYVVDKHPSGRFRFGFEISDMKPGRYRVRLAFVIRDAGAPPSTTEGELLVRPAPGYVPPPEEVVPPPLRFPPEATSPEPVDAPTTLDTSRAPKVVPRISPPVEPPRVEPARAEPPRAESPRAESPRAEAPRVESPRVEPVRAEPARAESPRAEAPRVDPGLPRPIPPRTSDTRAEPRAEQRVGPRLVEASRTDLPEPPTEVRPAEIRHAEIRHAEIRPAEIRPVEPRPAEIRPAETRPVGPRLALAPTPVKPPVQPVVAMDDEEEEDEPDPIVVAAPPTAPPPIVVQIEEEPVVPQVKRWIQEPVPNANRPLAGISDESSSATPVDDEDEEPSVFERMLHQLRNDPYVLVMALLAGIITILLFTFLLLQE